MEKNINNTSIYNDLANPYYLFLFIFQIGISNTIISHSNEENEFSKLIDEMEDDADYENDENGEITFVLQMIRLVIPLAFQLIQK